MKRTIWNVLVVLLCTTVSVYAQQSPQSADEIVSKMKSQLNLSEDEANAVKPIIEDSLAKRKALKASMQDGSVDKSAIRSQMQQLKDEEKEKLSQILTADEMNQWETLQSQMNQGHRHKHDAGSGE